jgi:hypothetical protein
MSISGILSSSYNQYGLCAASTPYRQGLNQLGQDLKSGNLSAAQSDFATLQAAFSQSATTSSTTSNPVAQAFHQLGQDLESGSLSAAQKDFSTIQQDLQNLGPGSTNHIHHHHRLRSGSGDSTNQNSLLQDLNQVGQSLTSGNLSAAQQAYATLQQQLEQFALGGGALSTKSRTLQAQAPVSLLA